MPALSPVHARFTLPDGQSVEAPIRRCRDGEVFLITVEDVPLGAPLHLVLADEHGPILSFRGESSAALPGRGIKVHVAPGTGPGVDDFVARELTPVSESTDLQLEQASPHRPKSSDLPGQPAANTSLSGLRVLVIDDDPGIVKMLSRGLARFGCQVQATSSPEEGLALARDNSGDVILLDWMLPDIPGARMLEQIRQTDDLTPVAVISGALWWRHAADHLRAQGATEVLEKPIDFEQLVFWLQRVARQRTPDLAVAPAAEPATVPSPSDR